MFRTSLALAVMASMMLAGCLDGGGGLQTSSSPGPQTSEADPVVETSSAPVTTTPAPQQPANEAPQADLVVKQNETVIEAQEGVFYLGEEPGALTFDASNSTDPEDDELSYAWTVDGEVDESLEGPVVSLTLTPGTHAISVDVSDGDLSDSREVIVTIAGLTVDLPPVASDGAITSYRFEGDFDATAMAAPVTEEDVQQLHSFLMPAGAQKMVVHMSWGDNASIPEEGSIGPILPFPAGNLDLRLVDSLGEEAAAGDATLDYEHLSVAADQLVAGSWVAAVDPILVAAPVHYSLDIIIFLAAPTVTEFSGTFVAQQTITNVAPEDLPPDGVPALHTLSVPAGVKGIVARLEWAVPEDAPAPGQVASNLDFTAMVGDVETMSSDRVFAFEFDSLIDAAGVPAGDWVFEITPLASPASEYTLTVEFL